MRKLSLSLSKTQAAAKLKRSLAVMSSDALRIDDQLSAYGEVHDGESAATFDFGMGLTGRTGVRGEITDEGANESELSYDFYGPFWAFLSRITLDQHLTTVFAEDLPKKSTP